MSDQLMSDPESHMASVHVVVPTLSASRAEHVADLYAKSAAAGASFTVYANSRGAQRSLETLGVPNVSSGSNVGFARAVNAAAQHRSSQCAWLLIVNDDIEIADFAPVVDALGRCGDADLVAFGDEPLNPLPRRAGVFLSVSMLGGFRRKRAQKPVTGTVPDTHYFAFSFAAVRVRAWESLNGLDEEYPFSFEDADFARRAITAGLARSVYRLDNIRHLRGATGNANVDRVLPSATWGAYTYLSKWECSRFSASAICLSALVTRIPMVLASKSPKGKHLLGIARATKALCTRTRPELPRYEDF